MDIVWKTPVEIVLFKASKRTNSSGVQVFQVFVSIRLFQLAFLFSRSLVSSVAKALCGIIHPSGVNFRLEGIKGRLRRRESLAGIQISLGWNAFHIEHLIQKIENVCWLERDKPFLDINSSTYLPCHSQSSDCPLQIHKVADLQYPCLICQNMKVLGSSAFYDRSKDLVPSFMKAIDAAEFLEDFCISNRYDIFLFEGFVIFSNVTKSATAKDCQTF